MFRKVTNLAGTRVFSPYEYVMSFYRLGTILEGRGDEAGARDAYENFLSYWENTDMFQDEVGRAKAFVGP